MGTKSTTFTIRSRWLKKISLLWNIIVLLIMSQKTVGASKCHMCSFHLAHCTNPLDCYNQPDTCSNTNFSPILSQVVDCEFGCEQYVITDATGSLVLWRRGCATQGAPRSSYICFSRNIYFLRHEQCWCHTDYCNSSKSKMLVSYLMLLLVILMTIVLQIRVFCYRSPIN